MPDEQDSLVEAYDVVLEDAQQDRADQRDDVPGLDLEIAHASFLVDVKKMGAGLERMCSSS